MTVPTGGTQSPSRIKKVGSWAQKHWFWSIVILLVLLTIVGLFWWHPWSKTTTPAISTTPAASAQAAPAAATATVSVSGIDKLTGSIDTLTGVVKGNTTATTDNTAATKENTTALKSNTDKVIATAPAAAPPVVYIPAPAPAPAQAVTVWVTEHELAFIPNKGHLVYEIKYIDGRRTEEVRFLHPERYIVLEGETLVTPAPPTQVIYIPTPTPAPTPVTQTIGNDCQMWTTNGSTMSWVGPTDGTMSICQTGDWLKLIRAGRTTIFSVSVPGTMEITTGFYSTTVAGNMTTYTVINSSGPSGGFRWTPLPGYGWRR